MEKPNIYSEMYICWFFDLYLFLEFGYLDEMYVILNVWSFFNVHCYFWCENKIRNYIYQKSASEFLWEYNYAYLLKKKNHFNLARQEILRYSLLFKLYGLF